MFELKLENSNGSVVNINDGVNYVVTSITGLNPPSASLFVSKSSNRKGGRYNGSTLNERNIIVTIKLLGDIEAARNALYEWIDTEQYVKVYYRNGVKNVYCEGYVEDCPIDLFTDNEVISVAILCPNPYWKDLQEISTNIDAFFKQFVFPFSISESGMPISTVLDQTATSLYYTGAETGLVITVQFLDNVNEFTVCDANNTSRKFTVKYPFVKGEVLEIDTESSPKTCKITHTDKKTENAMKYVSGAPTWFTLKKGHNYFDYFADGAKGNVSVTLTFRQKYLGV